jgi:cytochrome c peroxidase
MRRSHAAKALFLVSLLGCGAFDCAYAAESDAALVDLGRALFFDPNLSLNRNQSCATCHDSARAFIDSRGNGVEGAVSLGDDGRSLGDRNAPGLTYVASTPPLRRGADGAYEGGLFHDGRARDLVDQAGQPMLNPREMNMPDAAAVVARVNDNPLYVAALRELGATGSVDETFTAVRGALAAFERTQLFASYDSRYDRALRGELSLTREEELGRMLFFSSLTNCSNCHVLDKTAADPREPFTSFRYFNIGVPPNTAVRSANGHTAIDRGLRDNPDIHDDELAGKFRVPTLRNVAVTGPYMHNGVFRDLGTVLLFYNQYLAINEQNLTNPETGRSWESPEVPNTIDRDLLRTGLPLDDTRIQALTAFLRALTDQRYEPLLAPQTAAP